MKDTATKHALIELQRRTGLVIEPRHEADALAAIGEAYDAGESHGKASAAPAPKRTAKK